MGNDFVEDHRGVPPESRAGLFRKTLSIHGHNGLCLKDAERLFSMLASSPRVSARQVEQATDARTILFGIVFGQEWGRAHDTLFG